MRIPCPICHGRKDPDCLCDADGTVPAPREVRTTRVEKVILAVFVTVGCSAWVGAFWVLFH